MNLNEIDHGESFSNENYNGYVLSYMCVRYLIETLGIDEFKTFTYYDKIYNLSADEEKISNI